MKHADMARVLARCASFDQRVVTADQVTAWHEVAGHLDVDHAIQAVAHFYAHHRNRMWPVDLTETITMLRSQPPADQPPEGKDVP
ncbi:hypothetical protein QEZ54_08610 [Catellatospora sp. KI3]|uniref:hypothetical protein n=1 Tax=Catellatospora sp. KI3 TaxID=3041620 RepID=UPI0024825F46|nr:hypothetical protein [Catellatospora sp. KI3]MDI1461023.1 hypothetical protein [Catellatospora sp. KI3]